MALKKVSKQNNNRAEEIKQRQKEISDLVANLKAEYKELNEELLSIQIAPFKLGGYALAEISSGRSKKWQKCLLECENGSLYVRPVKDNGELSGRHFSIFPWNGKTYADYLKEVE